MKNESRATFEDISLRNEKRGPEIQWSNKHISNSCKNLEAYLVCNRSLGIYYNNKILLTENTDRAYFATPCACDPHESSVRDISIRCR